MNTASLSGFLALTEAQYRVVDLGSQLRVLPISILDTLDNGQPYVHPYLGYAWLSILLWNPENPSQNSFWFFKLPLDEQGILAPGVHSDLVNRLYRSISSQDDAERHRLINDHPYQFSLNDEKQAALHAYARVQLSQPPSQYYPTCYQFFVEGQVGDWRDLGLQGIADVVQRLDPVQAHKLIDHLANLPREALIALCHQLEHTSPEPALAQALLDHAGRSQDLNEQLAILRAYSQSNDWTAALPTITHLLNHRSESLELVLLIIARYPQALLDDDLALIVFERLAQLSDAEGFGRIVQNCALIPGMNGFVMRLLRHPNLGNDLANALALMIQMQRGQHVRH